MKPIVTLGLGAAVVLGTLVAFGRNARFLGDKAEKGDEVLVPADVIASLSPELRAAGQIAQGSTVIVQVVTASEETLTGPIVRITFAQTEVPLEPAVQQQIGSVTVPRSAVIRITRAGQNVAA